MPLQRPLFVGAVVLAAVTLAACGGGQSGSGAAGATPSATASPRPAMVVSGGTTTLRLSATTRRVLDVAGVHLDAASGATTGEGRLSFPITGGRLRFTPLRGHIEHRGALRIRAGGRSVKLTNLVVDPGRKRITGDLAGRRIPLMSLDFAMPRTPPPAGGPVILPAKATLLASSAVSTLGDQFGVHALKAGLPLGSVYIAARPAGGA